MAGIANINNNLIENKMENNLHDSIMLDLSKMDFIDKGNINIVEKDNLDIINLGEVLIAYGQGKTIQRLDTSCVPSEWEDTKTLSFHIPYIKYRVKPTPKMRPYANAEEFLQAQKEHGPYIKTENYASLGKYTMPYTINDTQIRWKAGYDIYSNWEELSHLTWQDGTPCQIIE